MIYIEYAEITTDKAIVRLIHYKPFDPEYGLGKTQDELELTGIFVDSIPEPEVRQFQTSTLYVNPQTKELWYEYTDRPLTPEEEFETYKKQLQATQDAVDFLLMGGM